MGILTASEVTIPNAGAANPGVSLMNRTGSLGTYDDVYLWEANPELITGGDPTPTISTVDWNIGVDWTVSGGTASFVGTNFYRVMYQGVIGFSTSNDYRIQTTIVNMR